MTKLIDDPILLTKKLIGFRSITPDDAGSLEFISSFVERLGFRTKVFSTQGVKNLFARWSPKAGFKKTLAFNGHVDVVPTGEESLWDSDPFIGDIRDGRIFGRGSVDMKSSVAAFLIALKEIIEDEELNCSFVLLITSDEEGHAEYGTKELLKWVVKNKEVVDHCLIGEPTSSKLVGDTIKIGRRGSLSGFITCKGKQGHIAYPEKAVNPVEELIHFLSKLKSFKLDDGSEFFEPSSLNISTIDTNNEALNIIPENSYAKFNVRFNDQHSCLSLTKKIDSLLAKHNEESKANLEIKYKCSGESFLTEPNQISEMLTTSIKEIAGIDCTLSTGGGTSDARFMRDYCPVVEFGLIGDTMHQINENTKVSDIVLLKDIYKNFLKSYNKKVKK
ncbi:succinyl-diaminopimelate desuccinylase [Paracoccaceae bacterium]|nr:succinyl-diaminopimelate desuccinylase [Paracoccaceae bacterium]